MNKMIFKSVVVAVFLVVTASAVFAAGGGGHADAGVLLKDFLYRCLNFGVTFALLAFFVVKPIKRGLQGRRSDIEQSLNDAQELQKNAEAKFAEYERKLADADAEIEDVYASIRREGELERERILANAREMAEKIEKEAERTAALEVAKARAELRADSVKMAVKIAEEILASKMTQDDHKRLVNEYLQKVGELH